MFNISGEALMSKCLSISPPPQDKLVKESEKPSTNQGFADQSQNGEKWHKICTIIQ
jgi:hypothetical protein